MAQKATFEGVGDVSKGNNGGSGSSGSQAPPPLAKHPGRFATATVATPATDSKTRTTTELAMGPHGLGGQSSAPLVVAPKSSGAFLTPKLPSNSFANSQGQQEAHSHEQITILSVDDDEVNHEVMCAALTKCNYEVVVVMSGTACLKYIEECTKLPQIILLDVMMPGISGLDVLVELRKKYSVVELPIIMVSAKNSTAAVVKGLELQCNDWVHKPFDRLELIARVNMQLKIRQLFLDRPEPSGGAALATPPALEAAPAVVPIAAARPQPGPSAEELRLQRALAKIEVEHAAAQRHLAASERALETCRAEHTQANSELKKARNEREELQKKRVAEEARRNAEAKKMAQEAKRMETQIEEKAKREAKMEAQIEALEAHLEVDKKTPHIRFAREQKSEAVQVQLSQPFPEPPMQDETHCRMLMHHNAHLVLQLRGRERRACIAEARLQQQVHLTQQAQNQCEQLERVLRKLQVDSAFGQQFAPGLS